MTTTFPSSPRVGDYTMEARKHIHVPCISDPTNQDQNSYPVDDKHVGNIVTSRCVIDDSIHLPAIDIDHEVVCYESATEGHSHLYFNVPMTWEQYVKLLTVMVEVGLVEPKYLEHSLKSGHTGLRTPEFLSCRPKRGSIHDPSY